MDKKMFKIGLGMGALVAICLGVYVYYNSDALTNKVLAPEIELSKLKLKSIENLDVTFDKERPKVVNFWATWCAPCLEEFPYFQKMKDKYGDKVEFVFVSDEKIETIKGFQERNDYTLNFVHNTFNLKEFNLVSLPMTAFYDAQGRLKYSAPGKLSEALLDKEVLALINE